MNQVDAIKYGATVVAVATLGFSINLLVNTGAAVVAALGGAFGLVGTWIFVRWVERFPSGSSIQLDTVRVTSAALRDAYELVEPGSIQEDRAVMTPAAGATEPIVAGDIEVDLVDSSGKVFVEFDDDYQILTSRPKRYTSEGLKNPAEFVTFWEDTYTRIVQYHQEAHGQLKSAYRLAQLSALCGFLVVGGLGVAAARASSSTQAIAAAAVGTVGAALAAYIGHTFNATYTQTLARSRSFFHEPVVIARLLAAERLLAEYGQGNEKERAEALTVMISAAVNFESGQVPEESAPKKADAT